MSECKFEGQSKVADNLEKLNEEVLKALKDSMKKIGDGLKDDAVNLTPVDTGALRESAFCELDESGDSTGDVTVVVGYEKDVPEGEGYGVYVHERMDLHHNVGQAKFLETPYKELEAHYLQDVVNDLKKVFQ